MVAETTPLVSSVRHSTVSIRLLTVAAVVFGSFVAWQAVTTPTTAVVKQLEDVTTDVTSTDASDAIFKPLFGNASGVARTVCESSFGTSCDAENTCCDSFFSGSKYGCCPHKNAVCCPGVQLGSCCPQGTTCEVFGVQGITAGWAQQAFCKAADPADTIAAASLASLPASHGTDWSGQGLRLATPVCKPGTPEWSATMPNVVMMGDSFTQGYYHQVKQAFHNEAMIHTGPWASDGAAEDTKYSRACLKSFLSHPDGTPFYPDVIYFNLGLHNGPLHDEVIEGAFSYPGRYKEDLTDIVAQIKAQVAEGGVDTKIIFASTTPLCSDRLAKYTEMVQTLNEQAKIVMADAGIPYLNLFDVMANHCGGAPMDLAYDVCFDTEPGHAMGSACPHLDKNGYDWLAGSTVIPTIRQILKDGTIPAFEDLGSDDFSPLGHVWAQAAENCNHTRALACAGVTVPEPGAAEAPTAPGAAAALEKVHAMQAAAAAVQNPQAAVLMPEAAVQTPEAAVQTTQAATAQAPQTLEHRSELSDAEKLNGEPTEKADVKLSASLKSTVHSYRSHLHSYEAFAAAERRLSQHRQQGVGVEYLHHSL
eukprot:SAG11_NODE_886_length_6730_cov_3.784195_3_plen_590_part_00